MLSSKGTRPNGDVIPLKHRPAGLFSQENDSYRSRSNPRIGNKPFYKHENNHANGVDDSPLEQVSDFKLKSSDRCVTSINELKSASSYCSALDDSYNQNFPANYSIISMGYYQEDKRLIGNGIGYKGRDNQRGNRNSSSRSAVGVGDKTFNRYDNHHDKSLLCYDDSDDVFVDNVTLDASLGKNKSLQGPNSEDAHTERARSCSRRSCTNKSLTALDGCYNKDYIPVTHRPARKADDLFCTRPPLPRGDVRVALNHTLTGIEDGSSQANMFTKRGTRRGDVIPLKHRPAGLITPENDSYRSQSNSRIGNKPFYKHENNHANGVDDSPLGQVSDFKLKSSDRCVTSTNELKSAACFVTVQPNLFMKKDAVGTQKSGHYKQEVSGDGRVTSIVNSEKVTDDGTVECVDSRLKQLMTDNIQAQSQDDAKANCVTSHLEKWIGGHIHESQDDTGVYQQAALKHNQTFAGFDSSYSDYIGAKKDEQPSNYVAAVSDDGWGVDALSDVVTERAVVVSKAEPTDGYVMKVPKDHTMESQWIHCMKLKEFSCDILPTDENVGIYTCIGGGVMSMPYVVVVENYAMFYRTDDEEAQKMPPHFEFQLIPLVEPLDNRVVPGVYRYISSDHEIYPQVMELIDMGSAYSSRDLVDYEADRLNMASTSVASDPTNNE